MKRIICSVYDAKSLIYGLPYFSINVSTALRDFERASLDPNSNCSVFPEDYILYELGTFDDATCDIDLLPAPISHGNANQFRR